MRWLPTTGTSLGLAKSLYFFRRSRYVLLFESALSHCRKETGRADPHIGCGSRGGARPRDASPAPKRFLRGTWSLRL